jgi:hypothetical protein
VGDLFEQGGWVEKKRERERRPLGVRDLNGKFCRICVSVLGSLLIWFVV